MKIPDGNRFLDDIASGLSALISNWLNHFGAGINHPILGSVTLADVGATICFILFIVLVNAIVAGFIRYKTRQAGDENKPVKHHVFGALGKPLYLLIWVYGIYLAATPLLLKLPADQQTDVRNFFDKLFDLGVFAVLIWLFYRFTHVLEVRLSVWAGKTSTKFDDLLVPLIGKSLRVIVPVVGIIFAIPVLNLSPEYAGVLAKGSSILLIIAIAIILFQAVNVGEKFVVATYDIKAANNLQARKIYTQIHVLSKTLYVVIGIFTIASVLMLFEEVRRLGTSLLASAGVLGIILGFAAQKTISNLFAGFQLAMTQPIRLDDVVIVEGEWGRVEEISLTYVIIHIWDDRRLVVPLSYFIEKPFQNWTRASAQLLGSVFVWTDYTLPLEEARKALKEIIENHPLWDKRFWNLQVTDATEKTMQLRVLATSEDSSKSWDLRCAIREQFIAYIQKNYPQSLPRIRAEVENLTAKTESSSTPSPAQLPAQSS